VSERLSLLERLIADWHGPCRPGDGYSEPELAGLLIPGPLRWWYRLGGRRRGIFDGQNLLLRPDQLAFVDRMRLLVYTENQGVYHWSICPEGDDPPVWGRWNDRRHSWRRLGLTLSGLLIQAFLFELVIATHCRASASWIDQDTKGRVLAPLTRLPLPSWGYPPGSRFHLGPGVVVFTAPNGESQGKRGFSIWIGARADAPLDDVRRVVDDQWEFLAL
jgi:hypothetical protein